MIYWGTSFGSHDAALSVFTTDRIGPIIYDRLIFASHSERFSRIKDDANLCQELIDHAIQKYGHPNRVYYYEKPWKKKLRYIKSGQWDNITEPSPRKTLAEFGVHAPIITVDHHHSHAAAGYYTSGFRNATIIVVDAIGELATTTMWIGKNDKIKKVYQQNYPHSIGLFYSALTQAAGYKPNGEEYIFMGAAAYGKKEPLKTFIAEQLIELQHKQPLVKLKQNLHRGYKDLYARPPHDIAAAGQSIYEDCLDHLVNYAYKNFRTKNLILMGGCALNCVANSRVLQSGLWENIWIMPNPGDAGSAVGTVLAARGNHIEWPGPYLGYNIPGPYPIGDAIQILKTKGIVGIANGPAEFGPRALGNRSIFADPRIPDIKTQMNWLKKREQFRPFAAIIPEQFAAQEFVMGNAKTSPYMQFVFECKNPQLYPGIAHVDNTSRIQTVSPQQHPKLYEMLMGWYQETGCPMLINTSLNIKGQPLVNTEDDARAFEVCYDTPVLK
mgnify:CR=1 FL=1